MYSQNGIKEPQYLHEANPFKANRLPCRLPLDPAFSPVENPNAAESITSLSTSDIQQEARSFAEILKRGDVLAEELNRKPFV